MIKRLRNTYRFWVARRRLEKLVAANRNPEYLKRREAGKKGWARRLADRAVALRVEPVPVSPVPASIPSRVSKHARKRRQRISQIIARDGFNCWLCGEANWQGDMTIDHAIPKARGGTNELHNLRLAHRRCNEKRGMIQSCGTKAHVAHAMNAATLLKRHRAPVEA